VLWWVSFETDRLTTGARVRWFPAVHFHQMLLMAVSLKGEGNCECACIKGPAVSMRGRALWPWGMLLCVGPGGALVVKPWLVAKPASTDLIVMYCLWYGMLCGSHNYCAFDWRPSGVQSSNCSRQTCAREACSLLRRGVSGTACMRGIPSL